MPAPSEEPAAAERGKPPGIGAGGPPRCQGAAPLPGAHPRASPSQEASERAQQLLASGEKVCCRGGRQPGGAGSSPGIPRRLREGTRRINDNWGNSLSLMEATEGDIWSAGRQMVVCIYFPLIKMDANYTAMEALGKVSPCWSSGSFLESRNIQTHQSGGWGWGGWDDGRWS